MKETYSLKRSKAMTKLIYLLLKNPNGLFNKELMKKLNKSHPVISNQVSTLKRYKLAKIENKGTFGLVTLNESRLNALAIKLIKEQDTTFKELYTKEYTFCDYLKSNEELINQRITIKPLAILYRKELEIIKLQEMMKINYNLKKRIKNNLKTKIKTDLEVVGLFELGKRENYYYDAKDVLKELEE